MRAGRGGEGAMNDKARAASAYRTAHARGAVGRVGVALVRTAALSWTEVGREQVAGRKCVELLSCQWRAGDVWVVVFAAALPVSVGSRRTIKMDAIRRQLHAGEDGCGEPLQLVVVQVEVLEIQAIEDARRQRHELVPGQEEPWGNAYVVKHAWRQRRDALVCEIQRARLVGALARALQRAVARLAEDAPAERARQAALIARIEQNTCCRPAVGVLSARARHARSTARRALVLAGLARSTRRSVAARVPLRDAADASEWLATCSNSRQRRRRKLLFVREYG